MIGYHHESLNKVERVVDKETSKICSCLKEASNLYQFSLNTQGGAEAKKYFESRNISQEMISYFSLGFSPDDSQISISILMNKGYDIDTLDNAGIFNLNLGNNFEFLKKAFVRFMELGKSGFVCSMLNERSSDKESPYFYYNPKHVCSFAKDAGAKSVRIIDDYLENDFTVFAEK